MCPHSRDAGSATRTSTRLHTRSSAARDRRGAISARCQSRGVSSAATDKGERMAESKQTRTSKTSAASRAPTEPVSASQPAAATPAPPPAAAEPHPSSSHRSPREIANEEAGPGGPSPEPQAQEASVPREKAPSKEDEHIREAVQRSAHRDRARSSRGAGIDPADRSGNRSGNRSGKQ
jgi:DNA polymerase III gamma/tau subunit